MAEANAVKIPPYNFGDPALWLLMCESTFELGTPKPITESKTKFNYVVSHLPPEVASMIRDVIATPSKEDPYLHVKTELIKRSGESSHQAIRKLLVGEELGDRKPSELLRIMRRRAEAHNVPDELMLELFNQHMPRAVQTILAALTDVSLDKAAEIADRVVEVTPIPVSDCSVSSVNSIEDKLLAEIKKLHIRIDALSRSRSQTRNKNFKPRERSRSKSQHFENCWYHYKFGEKAKKCNPPCNFSKN